MASSSSAAGGPAGVANVVMDGWLRKEGGRFKTWKKRWFALDAARQEIFYFRTQVTHYSADQIRQKQDSFVLKDAMVYRFPIKKFQFAFQIKTAKRVYVLAADSVDTLKQWMLAVQGVVDNARTQNPALLNAVTVLRDSSMSQLEPVEIHGTGLRMDIPVDWPVGPVHSKMCLLSLQAPFPGELSYMHFLTDKISFDTESQGFESVVHGVLPTIAHYTEDFEEVMPVQHIRSNLNVDDAFECSYNLTISELGEEREVFAFKARAWITFLCVHGEVYFLKFVASQCIFDVLEPLFERIRSSIKSVRMPLPLTATPFQGESSCVRLHHLHSGLELTLPYRNLVHRCLGSYEVALYFDYSKGSSLATTSAEVGAYGDPAFRFDFFAIQTDIQGQLREDFVPRFLQSKFSEICDQCDIQKSVPSTILDLPATKHYVSLRKSEEEIGMSICWVVAVDHPRPSTCCIWTGAPPDRSGEAEERLTKIANTMVIAPEGPGSTLSGISARLSLEDIGSQFLGICEYSNALEGFSICFPARFEVYEDVCGVLYFRCPESIVFGLIIPGVNLGEVVGIVKIMRQAWSGSLQEFVEKWKEDFLTTFGEVSEVTDTHPRRYGSHYFAGFQLNLPERNEDASFSGNKHFLVKCCKSEDPQAPSIGWTVVLVVPSQIFIQKNSSMFYNILLSSLELY